MKKHRPWRLRWRLAIPLMAAFSLLWLGNMILLTNATRDTLESTVSVRYQSAQEALEDQWGFYENNRNNGLGSEADHIMMYNLSDFAFGLIGIDEGGMAFLVRDAEGNEIRSQLAYGYGHVSGVDEGQRWHLYLDQGLDDAGQIRLAEWIVGHRNRAWGFVIYPPDSWAAETVAAEGGDLRNFDGTYARVTGIERPGYALDVQKIELVHPDGTTETMVETGFTGENPITLELQYLKINSVLLPTYYGNGKVDHIDMERRLSNFREAQAILTREAAGVTANVQTSQGKLLGMKGGSDDSMRMVAGQCDVFRAAVADLQFLYGSTFLLTVAVVLLLSVFLSRKVTEPVEELSQAAQGGRCRADGPIKELNALAAAFNTAQEQLEGQLERERTFTRAAAHELKTPLTILRTHAEALREDIAPENREQYLDVVVRESDRMADLVGRMLELSRLEAGMEGERSRIDLAALVQEVWSPLQLQLQQREITLDLELEEIETVGNWRQLKEAVENLATNAVRYCARGCIRVSLVRQDDQACLSVYNDGPAIPDADLPHLFEPFYRGDPSRSRDSGGSGLGLAIVRAAILAHGGRCAVQNMEGGPCFQIWIPIVQENL